MESVEPADFQEMKLDSSEEEIDASQEGADSSTDAEVMTEPDPTAEKSAVTVENEVAVASATPKKPTTKLVVVSDDEDESPGPKTPEGTPKRPKTTSTPKRSSTAKSSSPSKPASGVKAKKVVEIKMEPV